MGKLDSAKVDTTQASNHLAWLGLLFVYLKLTGQIAWSWWWVTLPYWGPIGLLLAVVLIGLLLAGIGSVIK